MPVIQLHQIQSDILAKFFDATIQNSTDKKLRNTFAPEVLKTFDYCKL
jgi:hypothetical protein